MKTDYKETLNLPKTAFPMKANLARKELEILDFWVKHGVYQEMQEKDKSNTYILHDGPPYANGHIHLGHALNKILKDIIIKYKSMKGFYSPFVPGWDCHGLPIEHEVDKNLGSKKENISILEKRRLCKEYALKFLDIQREEFKRLGVFGDWAEPYITMSFPYEASIVREFGSFVEKGYVYKGKKPVRWCPSCVTALAEAEVEYADKESPSIYVKFRILDDDLSRIGLEGKNAFFIIWTTTPWTLPANLALAVKPEIEYWAIEVGDSVYIISRSLAKNIPAQLWADLIDASNTPLSDERNFLPIKGDKLIGIKARHPFIDRVSKVVAGDFVSVEEGTGIVHIAPGHGEDDYETGLRHGLDIYAPVDKYGKFTKQVEGLEGQFVFKANSQIIDTLKNKDALIRKEKVTHSYPHCWRCKKPVIFRATEQWFISMAHNELRQKALEEINKTKWVPSWGKNRIYGMIKNRPDWCISRQRSWGVPITLLQCKKCNELVTDRAVLDNIVSEVEKAGADVWFEKSEKELLPKGYKCKNCNSEEFTKETDILDVWFDSGVSHAAVVEIDKRLSWPADLYLEGSDQHRGWFQSSLLASVGTRDTAPYNAVLTHGFVVDGQGKKMSKSLGNVTSPQEVTGKHGAEILRLWSASADYREDMRISNEILDRLVEAYRKIRNTCRFLLGNLHDFDISNVKSYETLASHSARATRLSSPKSQAEGSAESSETMSKNDILEIDRLALCMLQSLIEKVTKAYENFEFHEVFHATYNFCVINMSAFYLDVLKDRLYTFKSDSKERRASQWVLHKILISLTKIMAPILSFTAEEIWRFIPGNTEGSVFLTGFPEVETEFADRGIEKKWENLLKIRDEVNKALEIKRQEKFIGNSLEAKVNLYVNEANYKILEDYKAFLPTLFIVSSVEVFSRHVGIHRGEKDTKPPEGSYKSPEISGMAILIEKAGGKKCIRCWNWSLTVGKYEDFPELCERCHGVLNPKNAL